MKCWRITAASAVQSVCALRPIRQPYDTYRTPFKRKNIIVAVTLGKNGVDVDFNIVSSVFGKGNSKVVSWINKSYLTFVNKEKALSYLHFSESGISEATENKELSSATNIVKDFVNPSLVTEKILMAIHAATPQRAATEQEAAVQSVPMWSRLWQMLTSSRAATQP